MRHKDECARAMYLANVRYCKRRPRINVQLASVCAQLRARTMRQEVQASIAVSKLLVELGA